MFIIMIKKAESSSETSVQRRILRKRYLHLWVLLEKDRSLGEMCLIEYCSVRFTHCLVGLYLVVFLYWFVYFSFYSFLSCNSYCNFFVIFVISRIKGCFECSRLFMCDVCYCIKRPLGKPRRRWVDNIRTDLQEVGRGYMDWMGWPRIQAGGGCLWVR